MARPAKHRAHVVATRPRDAGVLDQDAVLGTSRARPTWVASRRAHSRDSEDGTGPDELSHALQFEPADPVRALPARPGVVPLLGATSTSAGRRTRVPLIRSGDRRQFG